MKKTIVLLFALLGMVVNVNAKTIYLNAGVWNAGEENETLGVWAHGSSTLSDALYVFSSVGEASLFSVDIDDSYSKIILLRYPSNTEYWDSGYPKTEWNKTAAFDIPTDAGCYFCKMTGWNSYLYYGNKFYLYFSNESNALGGSQLEMTQNGYKFKATIDNQTDPKELYSMIVGSSGISDFPDIAQWDKTLYPKADGDCYYLDFALMKDELNNEWKRWKTDKSAFYEISFNFATFGWSCTPYVSTTIGPDGYSTFSSNYNVAIPTGVKAYYATTAGAGKVNMTSFGDAGTGINSADGAFLQAEPGTYTFTPATDNPEAKSGNLLKKTTGSDIYDTSDGKVQYVFAKQGEPSELGFYKLANSLSPAKGKAYLETVGSAAGARLTISFDDEDDVTGIANVREAANNKQFFNLNGQRVAQPQKGLYIVNGKKMIMK